MDDDMRVWMVTLLLALPIGMLSPGVGADPDPVPGGPDGGDLSGYLTFDHTWADAVDAYGWEESRTAFDAFVEAVEDDPGNLTEDDIQALWDLNYGLTREGKGFEWFVGMVQAMAAKGTICPYPFSLHHDVIPYPVVPMMDRGDAGVGIGTKYTQSAGGWDVDYLGITTKSQACGSA